jgi:hypothetical protein
VLVTTAGVSKDITRSCETGVRLLVASGGSNNVLILGDIIGQGKCSSISPNKCRERGKEQVQKCIEAMWRERHNNVMAPECKTRVSGRTGAELVWGGIYLIREPARLTARMAYAACCIMRPSAGQLKLRVGGAIVGDKKCGGTKTGKEQYQTDWSKPPYDMDCSAWRARGICNAGG